jgi:hypothetical protein
MRTRCISTTRNPECYRFSHGGPVPPQGGRGCGHPVDQRERASQGLPLSRPETGKERPSEADGCSKLEDNAIGVNLGVKGCLADVHQDTIIHDLRYGEGIR